MGRQAGVETAGLTTATLLLACQRFDVLTDKTRFTALCAAGGGVSTPVHTDGAISEDTDNNQISKQNYSVLLQVLH